MIANIMCGAIYDKTLKCSNETKKNIEHSRLRQNFIPRVQPVEQGGFSGEIPLLLFKLDMNQFR